MFNVVLRSLRLLSLLSIPFFFFLLLSSYFYNLFQLTYPFFGLSYSTTDSFLSMFHFCYCVVHHCLFFSSSRFLLNIFSIISIHDSILLPRSWTTFIITTLNSFSDSLPISFHLIWYCRFLPWSFACYISFLSQWPLFIVFLLLLLSGIWWVKFVQVPVQASCWEVWCLHSWMELRFFYLMGMLWGVCELYDFRQQLWW